MTKFTELVVSTCCNVMQWAIDQDPAPQIDDKLSELKETLKQPTDDLAASVAANPSQ